jgi:hypothetical protein
MIPTPENDYQWRVGTTTITSRQPANAIAHQRQQQNTNNDNNKRQAGKDLETGYPVLILLTTIIIPTTGETDKVGCKFLTRTRLTKEKSRCSYTFCEDSN